MEEKKSEMDDRAQLAAIRNSFCIPYILIRKYGNGETRIQIQEHDHETDLRFALQERYQNFEKTIERLSLGYSDLPELKRIVDGEISTLEEILGLKDAEDMMSHFKTVFIDMDESGRFSPPAEPYRELTPSELDYVWSHFKVRREYLRDMKILLGDFSRNLQIQMDAMKLVRPDQSRELDKLYSEIWLCLERGYFREDMDPKELSVLRNRLFSLFGSSDKNYSKYRHEILERKEYSRFLALEELIKHATISSEDRPSRGRRKTEKKLRKTK